MKFLAPSRWLCISTATIFMYKERVAAAINMKVTIFEIVSKYNPALFAFSQSYIVKGCFAIFVYREKLSYLTHETS